VARIEPSSSLVERFGDAVRPIDLAVVDQPHGLGEILVVDVTHRGL
jgi:hypothetical protein